MRKMEVRVGFEANDQLGEGPVWSVEEGALYWVDILRPALQRWHPGSEEHTAWPMPAEIGSFALRESGGFVVALRTGLATFELEGGQITPIANPEAALPFTRFNDGKCDRQGRFWAGTMDEETPHRRAGLYRLDSAQNVEKIRGEVGISNGLGWSPDNRVFYYTDSATHTIYAYDFDPDSGRIANERVFAQTPGAFVPDGLTVDADGFVWSAQWDGWKLIRFSPDGQIDLEVGLPVQRPTSCTFGGPALRDLYVTSARTGLSQAEIQRQPLAGSILVIEACGRGLPEPKYAG